MALKRTFIADPWRSDPRIADPDYVPPATYPGGYQWIPTQLPGVMIGLRRLADGRAILVTEYHRDGRRVLLPFILGDEARRQLAQALIEVTGDQRR